MNGGRQRGTKLCWSSRVGEAREARVHDPELVAGVREVVDADVAGGVRAPGHEARVVRVRAARGAAMTAGWFWKIWTFARVPMARVDPFTAIPIGLGHAAEVGVELAVVGPHDDEPPALVGRDHQRRAEALEHLRERVRVLAREGIRRIDRFLFRLG